MATPITEQERQRIRSLRACGTNWTEIGRIMGRNRQVCRMAVDLEYAARRNAHSKKATNSAKGQARLRDYERSPERVQSKRERNRKWTQSPAGKEYRAARWQREKVEIPAKLREEQRISKNKMRANNPEYRLKDNLHSNFTQSAKRYQMKGVDSAPGMFGSTWQDFVSTQDPELVKLWNLRQNLVHLDHIRPIASFPDKCDQDQMNCCWNSANFQLMLADENATKKDSYTAEDEAEWAEMMRSKGYKGDLFLIHGEQYAAA